MRLTKLYLAGFKSFASPTEIPLPNHRVAIVGPNGCGKSNLIDAIRWVLGESSAKQLRGQALDDVIFAGSGQRPAASQAVVELTFDNSDRRLNGAFGAYDELVIRRSLGRDGQSQYRINQTRVRRRDVIDLFLGTGVGARSYSVIEQGQVNRIVDAKPEDLRAYLEETAGISVYRERRRETHQRLQHAEENLARLADLCGELERQQNSLERQAKAAERYRALQRSRRRLLIEQTAVALALAESAAAQTQAQAESAEQQAQAAHHALLAARYDLRQIDPLRQQAEARQQQLTAQQFALATARSARQGKMGELGARLDALTQQQHSDQRRLEQLQSEATEHAQKLADLAQSREHLRAERDQAANERAEHSAALKSADLALSADRQQLHRAMQQSADTQSQLAATRARIDGLNQQLHRLNQQLDTPLPDFSAAQHALDAAQAALNQELAQLTAAQQELSDARQHAQQQHEAAKHALHAAEQSARLAQDTHSTRDAERRALDTLLRAKTPTHTPRTRLMNRLAEANADPFWARALGEMTEADCVPNLDALAAEWQASGKRPKAGWWISPATPHPPDTSSFADYLTDWQTTCHRATDWADAMAQRHQLAPGHCFLFDDGWRIGRHWLGRPSDDTAAHTLAQHARLHALAQECADSAQALTCAQAARQQAQQHLADTQHALQHAHDALRANEQARAQHRFSQQDQDRQRAQQHKAQTEQTAARTRQIDERHSLRTEHDRLTQRLAQEQAAHHAAQSALAEYQSKIQAAEDALTGLRRAAADAQQRAQTAERSLDRATHQQEEILRASARNEAERDQILRRQQETADRRARWQNEIDQHTAERGQEDQALAALDLELKQIQIELAQHHAAQQEAQHTLSLAEHAQEQAQAAVQHTALARSEAQIRQQHAADALAQALHEGQDDGAPPSAEQIAALAADPATAERQATERARLDADIQRLGAVNLTAIDAFAETRARKDALDTQIADVRSAIEQLREAIAVLDRETRQQFKTIFDAVNARLDPLFQQLFGGGQAHLALTEADALDAGVQLFARPPGKKVTQLSLLSGGERALTAVALIFALFEQNPAPFCILDEVDAPLDEANVGRFCGMVSAMSDRVQFLFITHNKTTMASAQALIGVTMREAGVSRIVSVDVERAVALLTPTAPH